MAPASKFRARPEWRWQIHKGSERITHIRSPPRALLFSNPRENATHRGIFTRESTTRPWTVRLVIKTTREIQVYTRNKWLPARRKIFVAVEIQCCMGQSVNELLSRSKRINATGINACTIRGSTCKAPTRVLIRICPWDWNIIWRWESTYSDHCIDACRKEYNVAEAGYQWSRSITVGTKKITTRSK